MLIETSIDIDAPLDRVWAALVDFDRYPEWNPLTVKVRGEPREGETVRLTVHLGGQRMKRTHRVSRADGTALCWTIEGPQWLMHGERCQTLTDLGDGRTRYANREGVHGLAGPFVALTFRGTIRRALEATGEALKAFVEGSAQADGASLDTATN